MASKNSTAICKALLGIKSAITRQEIVERSGLTSRQVGGSMHNLVKHGTVIKHAGPTLRTTGYSLDPEAAEKMEANKPATVARKRRYTKRGSINVEVRPVVRIGRDNPLIHEHVETTLRLLIHDTVFDNEDLRRIALACHCQAVETMRQSQKPQET
jgi:hypothetical protein